MIGAAARSSDKGRRDGRGASTAQGFSRQPWQAVVFRHRFRAEGRAEDADQAALSLDRNRRRRQTNLGKLNWAISVDNWLGLECWVAWEDKLNRPLSIALMCVATASGCQNANTSSDASMTSEELAAKKAKWEGVWSGTWGDPCTGSIDVSNVTASRADVVYSWGRCGGGPGSTDTFGTFEGETLVVDLRGRTSASYKHDDPNTLIGRYRRPSDGSDARGEFTRSE